MQETLEKMRDAWSADDPSQRNEAAARGFADQFAADPQNDDWIAELRQKSVVEICESIDKFREAGMDLEVLKIEAYLLHAYEPQTIGSPPEPTPRQTNSDQE